MLRNPKAKKYKRDTTISLNPCVGHCNVFLRVISLEIVTVFFMNNPNEEIITNPIPQDCINDIKSVGGNLN